MRRLVRRGVICTALALLAAAVPAQAEWTYTIDSKQMVGFRVELHVIYTDGKRKVEETLLLGAGALEQLEDTMAARVGELERIDRVLAGDTAISKRLTEIPDVAAEERGK